MTEPRISKLRTIERFCNWLSEQEGDFSDTEHGLRGVITKTPDWNSIHPLSYSLDSYLLELFPGVVQPQIFEEAYQSIYDAHMLISKGQTPNYPALRRALAQSCFWINKVRSKIHEQNENSGPPKSQTVTPLAPQVIVNAPATNVSSNPVSILPSGMPDPLKNLVEFIMANNCEATIDAIKGKFDVYPSDIAKKGRYQAWDGWIKQHLKHKGKVWKFIP